MESDCKGSRGKVTQPTTSIGEMASLVNAAPRPARCLSEAHFYTESWVPSSPKTSELPATRSQNGAPYAGREAGVTAQLGKPTRRTNCGNARRERAFSKSGYILIQINIPDRASNAFSSHANADVE
jgi:hypothetical protein